MKNAAILAGLILPWLSACASAQDGGMDGAGALSIGLSWDHGVFTQPVWENGSLAYIVLNDRDEDVALAFARARCGDEAGGAGCTFGETIATWRLPARSLRKIAGANAAAISAAGQLLGVTANGTRLGLLLPEVAPRASELAVISNAGINSTSGLGPSLGQIETDFLVAPAAEFTLGLSLSAGGELTLSRTPSSEKLTFVDVLGVRSQAASIRTTERGFSVTVPASASDEAPVRVDVDVRVPESFSGKFVGFESLMCWETGSDGRCTGGRLFQRGVPVELPLD